MQEFLEVSGKDVFYSNPALARISLSLRHKFLVLYIIYYEKRSTNDLFVEFLQVFV